MGIAAHRLILYPSIHHGPTDRSQIIPTKTSVWHRAFNCFPDITGKNIDLYSSAAISIWVRVDDKADPAEQSDNIIAKLRNEGWLVGSELTGWSKEPHNGNEFVEQALLDGFVVRIHAVETEHLLLFSDSRKSKSVKEPLSSFIEKVEDTGLLYSLYSDQHNQYANGVSAAGADFLPLWSTKGAIAYWMPDYPTYQITEVDLNSAKEWILPELDAETMSVGMGCGDDELILVDPLLFQQQLPKIH